MVESGPKDQERAVAPPFEHRGSTNHRVRKCDVSAFDGPFTDERLESVEWLSHDVLHALLDTGTVTPREAPPPGRRGRPASRGTSSRAPPSPRARASPQPAPPDRPP